MENKPTDPERECLSCEKFFDCPYRSAKKTGCLSFTRDKSLERKKSIWEISKDT